MQIFSKVFRFEIEGSEDPNLQNYLAFMFPRMEKGRISPSNNGTKTSAALALLHKSAQGSWK